LRADNRAKPVLSRIHFPTRALTIEGKGACTDNNRSPYQSQTIWPFAKKHIA